MAPDHDSQNKATHGDADGLRAFAESTQKPEKHSAAQQLVELALDCYDLGIDPDGKTFGVRKGDRVVRHLVNGRFSLRKELAGRFYRETGHPASQNALTEAVAVLEAEPEEQGEPVEVFFRPARPNDDTIWVNMGDKAERVLRITLAGWEILDGDAEVPVLFRRTSLTAALPTPERGGDLEQIWQFVNMKSEDDRQVLRGWLVGAYALVGRPCPTLALLGEQGTAKTSSIRCTFYLVDPTTAPVRRPPNDADSYLHAVNNSRGTAFDNLSSIQRWMCDAMCRTVTGDSDVGRTFYTNGDSYVITVQGILGFTGIDVGAIAGDLAERCVWGELEVIKATERWSERELDAAWALAYLSMPGGRLDLVVAAIAALPSVALTEKPRMADFAKALAALDIATGANGLEHNTLAQESVAEDTVGTDKFLWPSGRRSPSTGRSPVRSSTSCCPVRPKTSTGPSRAESAGTCAAPLRIYARPAGRPTRSSPIRRASAPSAGYSFLPVPIV
ncbi:hypothetical protein HGI16_11870 [Brevibacterium casei]|uniref:hypothetical protein n=1 Tax=Brevibacterium casei TaxID=33889 RepID=UPI00186B668E|nr:hypothetical protein [Brevibacterium casei]MBE4695400.1 hypothetical protein [Brevibacterium casei]MBY3578522.1 hypothetical protein [Brevibacterium casei]